ncbi:MAG: DUF177 domain-containing protein [Prevotella sp.]|nr:DUF177 domain-containing protein [Prevotella sp.]
MQPEGRAKVGLALHVEHQDTRLLFLSILRRMYDLEPFKINLNGLQGQQMSFTFKLDDAYFETIGSLEILGGKILVELLVHKREDSFELCFHFDGWVILICDICLDRLEMPLEGDYKVKVILGDEYLDEDDTITIDKNDGVIDVSWLICEMLNLNVPIKHVHEKGMCNKKMEEIYHKLKVDEQDKGKTLGENPAWKELEKIKNTFKD